MLTRLWLSEDFASVLRERPQGNIDPAELNCGRSDKLEPLLLVVRDLRISSRPLTSTHVTLSRSRQRRYLPLFPRHRQDVVEQPSSEAAAACPPRCCEETDVVMICAECLALEGVNSVMELLSEDARRPCRAYMVLGGEDFRRRSGFQLGAVRVLRRLGAVSSVHLWYFGLATGR